MATTLTSGVVKPDMNDEITEFVTGISDSMGILDAWFPVGSIRQFTTNVDPNSFMPGVWSKIRGVFLFAEDSDTPAGTTGGAKTHNHVKGDTISTVANTPGGFVVGSGNFTGNASSMPPYRSVYTWERTA